MRKLKPNYNPETVQGELVEKVCEYFGRVYDDFEEERYLVNTSQTAEHLGRTN